MLFLLDSSVLITAQNSYYPIDAVPEFWSWLAHKAKSGHIKMPKEIYEEIRDGGKDKEKDLLFEWIQNPDNKAALQLKEEVELDLVRSVTEVGYAPDLTDVEIEKIGRDPFLIAYGLASPSDRMVLTAEVSESKKQRANRKVPDVCDQFGVKRDNLFFMLKELKFTTGWKP